MELKNWQKSDETSIRETGFQHLWASTQKGLNFQNADGIDMRAYGDILYVKTMELSRKVTDDLLIPIARWLNDPNWIKKCQNIENHFPNWSGYKKNQRQRIKRLKVLARERLRNYWHEIRKRKKYRKDIPVLQFRTSSRAKPLERIKEGFIAPIISPFSPPERQKAQTILQFLQARQMSISDLLPWKMMICSDLTEERQFTDLRVYCPDKADKISKLIHLLEMETEGKVKVIQNEPFGEITIKPLDIEFNQNIKITDQYSREYIFEWNQLSDNQQARIIADIRSNKILCSTV